MLLVLSLKKSGHFLTAYVTARSTGFKEVSGVARPVFSAICVSYGLEIIHRADSSFNFRRSGRRQKLK